MKVTIFGSGYVGLVTGACLASTGHHVICVDIDTAKVNRLQSGEVPIYEPGLDTLIQDAQKNKTITFTTDMSTAIDHAEVIFIAVGTPPDEDGSADLKYVLQVAQDIGQQIDRYTVIVNKSTVPVGTADLVEKEISTTLATRDVSVEFDVVSNPEFLKEGAAINDFMKPDRIIVGSDSPRAIQLMRDLYAAFSRNHDKLLIMDVRSAELTKYAANAMLATKISFMNEMANMAERLGADIERVRVGIGSDPRIGYHFIYPGCGYGGSCFPKDVKALETTARKINYQASLLQAVEEVNTQQKLLLVEKVLAHFTGDIRGKTFALWGLAFKPNTDDMREAPSRKILDALWQAGARVQAFDPVASAEALRLYGERDDLTLCQTSEEALKEADALLIVTEWTHFRNPDFELIKQTLNQPVIFDGRNIYNPERMRDYGFDYYSIGRPVVNASKHSNVS